MLDCHGGSKLKTIDPMNTTLNTMSVPMSALQGNNTQSISNAVTFAGVVLLHVLDFGLDVSLERSGVDGVALQNYCAEQEQLALERLRALEG